jgi:hypothetical protein
LMTGRKPRWAGCRHIRPAAQGHTASHYRQGVGAAKGTTVIPVLSPYKSIGCSPDKHPDTRTTAAGSDDGSRDSVHDRCLCIAAWRSVRARTY